jgi:Kef-type K+ transport system membrane component KefB
MPDLLLAQLAVILVVCRVLSAGLRRLRQPTVIAQIVAGIAIGPSLLGLWPTWQRLIFPPASVPVITAVGEVGLVLFMFSVGAELDLGLLRRHVRTAVAVSLTSILVPLAAGAVVASRLVGDHRLFPGTHGSTVEIGFLGVAVAITAFPVMARIIVESGISRTPVGATSLAAGSVTDAIAWCLLAVLLALMNATATGALVTGAVALALAALVLVARTSWAAPLVERWLSEWGAAPWLPARVLALLMAVAWVSAVAGLHPAFGAFLVGLAMPRTEVVQVIRRRVEPVVVNMLLPLFFVYAGLNTRIGALAQPGLIAVGLLLLVVAVVSKGVACWLAAVAAGHSPREALGVGALMNTRGLVELIVLTIGLQRGVITPVLYTIMVLVAVATTMMAGPIIHLVYPALTRESAPAAEGGGALRREGSAGS